MAETEQLVVALEARIRDFERNFEKANKVSTRNWTQIEGRAAQAGKNLENNFGRAGANISKSLSSLGALMPAALSGLATGVAISQVQKLADEWVSARNKIVAAGVDITRGDATTGLIADIAQRSRGDFSAVADLYGRLTRVGQDLKVSQADVATVTETVSKALALTGATAAETSSTLIQLGQALGSGTLQGDELRSLLENAPLVAKSIATEFGVSVSALKQLGSEGQLTSDRVFGALKRAAPEIEKAFSQTTATTAQAFKALEAAAVRYVGTSGTVKTVTTATGAAINGLANNFGTVATGAAALGAVLATRLVAAGLTPAATALLATTRAAAASIPVLNGMNLALGASVARANVGAIAMRGLGGALAFIGGPAGAAILGIGAAALYFSSKAQEASERSKSYAAALDRLRASSDAAATSQGNLGNQIGAATARQFEAQRAALNESLGKTQSDVASMTSDIETTMTRAANAMRSRGLNAAAGSAVDELREKFTSGKISAAELSNALDALAASNPNFGGLAARLGPLLAKLAGGIALAMEFRKQLAGLAGEQAKSADQEIAAKIPNPTAGSSYEQDSSIALNDPTIRALTGQGIAQRAVAEAQMDDTKKKIRDKQKELRDTILDAGGTVDMSKLGGQAAAIIAAEDAGKGGKKAGGGGAAKKTDFTREETGVTRRIRAMEAEAAGLGKSAFEAAKTEEAFRLLDSAKQSGIPITDALKQKVEGLSTAYANAKVALDTARQAQEQAKQQSQFFATSMSDAIGDLLIEGKSLSDVFNSLAKSLAKAALQAALLGQGPLAGLFGGAAPAGGGVGGILGALFKGIGGFADGGMISGPGGPRSDSILAAVSAGEYVINADAATKYGPLLAAINSGNIPHFADGGSVGAIAIPTLPATKSVRGGGQVMNFAPVINTTVEGGSKGAEADQKLGDHLAKQLEGTMRGLIVRELQIQRRPGNMLG